MGEIRESFPNLSLPSIIVSSWCQVPSLLSPSFCLSYSHNPQLWGTLLLGSGLQEVRGLPRPQELFFPETHPQPPISIPKLVPRDDEPLAFSPEKGNTFPLALSLGASCTDLPQVPAALPVAHLQSLSWATVVQTLPQAWQALPGSCLYPREPQ